MLKSLFILMLVTLGTLHVSAAEMVDTLIFMKSSMLGTISATTALDKTVSLSGPAMPMTFEVAKLLANMQADTELTCKVVAYKQSESEIQYLVYKIASCK